MGRLDFETRRENRLDAYRALAEKNRVESSSRYRAFKQLSDLIPLGQPILVGHHSERGHRADLKRIDNHMRKSIEADKKAEYYEHRIAVVSNSKAISSDDPKAVLKLKEKIGAAELLQSKMVQTNKAIRVGNDTALVEMGYSQSQINNLKKPDFCGRIGFASYQLQNNSANIRRMKLRLTQLEKLESMENSEKEIGAVRIEQDAADNRCKVFFPEKPSEAVRSFLKSNGFRWHRYNSCWQRHISNAATWRAEEAAEMYNKETN